MATIIPVEIDVNGQQATQEVNQFSGALDNADKSAEKLNDNLEKGSKGAKKLGDETKKAELSLKSQEARIKSLDGAINLVGGSIEVLTGGIVALGLASEEDAAAFEKFALGAIALADGTKRVFDGYKSLTEARQAYKDIQVLATAAEEADAAATAANTAAQTANTLSVGANTVATQAQAATTVAAAIAKTTLIKELKGTSIAANIANTAISALNKVMKTGAALGAVYQGNMAAFNLAVTSLARPAGVAALAGALTAGAIALGNYFREQEKANVALRDANKIYNDLNKTIKTAAREQEFQLRILTDSVEQRGLEAKAIDDLKKAYPGFEVFLTRENKLNEEGIKFLKTKIELRKAEAALALIAQKQVEEEVGLTEQISKIREEYGYTAQAADMVAKAREESRNRLAILSQEEAKYLAILDQAYIVNSQYNNVIGQTNELLKQQKTIVDDIVTAREKQNARDKDAVETWIRLSGGIQQTTGTIRKQIPLLQGEVEASAATFADYINNLNTKTIEFYESQTGRAISGTLQTAATFTRTLADVQDESSEEAFEAGKKYKIASVVTSAIQSSFEAYGAAQQFGPVLGPILGAAQVAAIAIAANKAIQDIQSSQFGGSGTVSGTTPTTPSRSPLATGGGVTNPVVTGINPTNISAQSLGLGGIGGRIRTNTGVGEIDEPIRAYVVTGDVVTGIQAGNNINRRRTLTGG